MKTTLSGDYFSARLETSNYQPDPVEVSVSHDGPGSLIHIWIGPINLALHVGDWNTICDAVNAAIDKTLAKV